MNAARITQQQQQQQQHNSNSSSNTSNSSSSSSNSNCSNSDNSSSTSTRQQRAHTRAAAHFDDSLPRQQVALGTQQLCENLSSGPEDDARDVIAARHHVSVSASLTEGDVGAAVERQCVYTVQRWVFERGRGTINRSWGVLAQHVTGGRSELQQAQHLARVLMLATPHP
jgi:hypothetical protein